MSEARVGVVIIGKTNHRFFSVRGEPFPQEKAFFFPWALLIVWHQQTKTFLPCPTLPITNQRLKRQSKGTCFFAKSGNIVGIFDEAKKKGFKLLLPKPFILFGEPCRDRTDNLLIKSQLLYQLS